MKICLAYLVTKACSPSPIAIRSKAKAYFLTVGFKTNCPVEKVSVEKVLVRAKISRKAKVRGSKRSCHLLRDYLRITANLLCVKLFCICETLGGSTRTAPPFKPGGQGHPPNQTAIAAKSPCARAVYPSSASDKTSRIDARLRFHTDKSRLPRP